MSRSPKQLLQEIRIYAKVLDGIRQHLSNNEEAAERLRAEIAEQCQHDKIAHMSSFMVEEYICGKKLVREKHKVPYRRCLLCGQLEIRKTASNSQTVTLMRDELDDLKDFEVDFSELTGAIRQKFFPDSMDKWKSLMTAKIDELWKLL